MQPLVEPNPISPDRRNELALIRTDLANERTLLSYSRTSLMIVGTGATVIKFIGETRENLAIGIALIVVGVVIFIIGVAHFVKQKSRIRGDGPS